MSSLLPDLLKTVLYAIEATFTHPGLLEDKISDAELSSLIKQTSSSITAREVLGSEPTVWRTLAETLHAGRFALEQAQIKPNSKTNLFPRLRDLVLLGRNMVARLPEAQDLSAMEGFEAEMRHLLLLCVERILREEKDKGLQHEAAKAKEMYKKTIVACLQYIHNFIVGNEPRKVHFFAQVFGPFPDDGNTVYSYTNNQNTAASAKVKQAAKKAAEAPKPHSTAPSNVPSSSKVCKPFYSPNLLTNIPRIFTPPEIEALPMILQSLVVPTTDSDLRMQNIRCNMLITLSGGVNILREMFIFLAQWDLEETHLSYRLMQQVVSSILNNGKLTDLYRQLKDTAGKDVISTEQCVVLKLLLSIWRPKQSDLDSQLKSPNNDSWNGQPDIDEQVAGFFCVEFLEKVLPTVRSIIQAQGKILKGDMKREDFQWSVWDMDRAYDGLYQLMDVIVIITEEVEITSRLMKNDTELVKQLIEFLGEMERIFPRYIKAKDPAVIQQQKAQQEALAERQNQEAQLAQQFSKKVNLTLGSGGVGAVERPYDVHPVEEDLYSSTAEDDDEEEEEEDTVAGEPEEFTWPHIKRFIVILLSNLAWRNKKVKNTIRDAGGLQLILNHCKIDDDNPYIREHAILCVRNLLEESKENQELIRQLEARQTVPAEMLEKEGFETFIGEDGKVGLRKKGTPHADVKG